MIYQHKIPMSLNVFSKIQKTLNSFIEIILDTQSVLKTYTTMSKQFIPLKKLSSVDWYVITTHNGPKKFMGES